MDAVRRIQHRTHHFLLMEPQIHLEIVAAALQDF